MGPRKPRLKPLSEQVVVITGASSGIGLATAQMAAARGATVVLTSRDDVDLQRAVDDICAAGGTASSVVADVADFYALQRVADHAVAEYGRIDTWVNDAGVSIFGMVTDVPVAALSDTPIPLQVHYSASKHAVKGFTDGLRMELAHEGAPIAVTLIQPASINTPYAEHAENYMGVEPALAPPVYAPELGARDGRSA